MTILETIDKIDDHDDLLIVFEAQLTKDKLNKAILIREVFALWYILIEGIRCKHFSENTIDALLKEKYKLIQHHFFRDSDFNFILGWMLSIAPWYFNNDFNEDYGYKLLYKAYDTNSKNNLYKWALRDHLNLGDNEIKRLNDDLKGNFDLYFNYGQMIREYFLSMLK